MIKEKIEEERLETELNGRENKGKKYRDARLDESQALFHSECSIEKENTTLNSTR